MAEKLVSGTYFISSLIQDDPAVGVIPEVDSNLMPNKFKVVILSGTPDILPPRWVLEELPNGRFILSVLGMRTRVQDNLIIAVDDQEPAEEWVLTRQADKNPHAYSITRGGTRDGWVVPSAEADTQIAFQILREFLPPNPFPPNELWSIRPTPNTD